MKRSNPSDHKTAAQLSGGFVSGQKVSPLVTLLDPLLELLSPRKIVDRLSQSSTGEDSISPGAEHS